jgi:DNA-binding Lrp family transcriptional regulator
MAFNLDSIDRRILNALQDNGRLQNNELAKVVGLSPSPCLRRVKILEDHGFIDRYAAILDFSKVKAGFTLFVRVWLVKQDEDSNNQFIAAMKALPEVTECYLMAGDCDFMLRVVAEGLEEYRKFQMINLTSLSVVRNVKTEIPMQKVKYTTKITL